MKNRFKRFIASVIALTSIFSFAACGNDGTATEQEATTTTTTAEVTRATFEQNEGVVDAVDSIAEEVKNEELEVTKKIKWLSWYEILDTSPQAELFKSIYGIPEEGDDSYGEDANHIIAWQHVGFAQRYERLAALIQSGDSPDMFVFETSNYPYSVYKRLFQSIDNVLDLSDSKWDETRDYIEMFKWGGQNYTPITNLSNANLLWYRRSVAEEAGVQDPYELYQNGNWTWDTFLEVCSEFSSPEDGKYCIDGYNPENSFVVTTGKPLIAIENGQLVSNLYDPDIERCMDYLTNLRVQEYVYPRGVLNNWSENYSAWAAGDILFHDSGVWRYEEHWTKYRQKSNWDDDDVFFVPFPRDPNADKYYSIGKQDSYMLVSGAQNIDGYKAWIDCVLACEKDDSIRLANREQKKSDFGWTDEQLDFLERILKETTPVFDFKNGIGEDIAGTSTSENAVESLTKQPYINGEFSYTQVRAESEGVINARLEEINASV